MHAWGRSELTRASVRACEHTGECGRVSADPRGARCQAEAARRKHARRGAPEALGREGRPPQSAPLERRACLRRRRWVIGGPHRGTARTPPVRTRGESRRGPRALRRRRRRQTATQQQPRMRARARGASRRGPRTLRQRRGRQTATQQRTRLRARARDATRRCPRAPATRRQPRMRARWTEGARPVI